MLFSAGPPRSQDGAAEAPQSSASTSETRNTMVPPSGVCGVMEACEPKPDQSMLIEYGYLLALSLGFDTSHHQHVIINNNSSIAIISTIIINDNSSVIISHDQHHRRRRRHHHHQAFFVIAIQGVFSRMPAANSHLRRELHLPHTQRDTQRGRSWRVSLFS